MATEQESVDRAQNQADPHAPVEMRAHVARLVQFLPNPAAFDLVRIGGQALGRIGLGLQGVGHGLGGQHAGLHGGVAALDLGRVEEARRTADQGPAGEAQARNGLIAAFVQGPRAVADAAAAFQRLGDLRMGFVALQFVERRQIGVLVVQADHEAEGDLIVFQVIQERAAIGLGIQRPADGVQDFALFVILGFDFPQFLDADAVGLRVRGTARRAHGAQVEFLFQLLAEVPAAAFGEQGVFGVQLHARLMVRAGGAVAVQAHVAGGDALDRAVVVEQNLGGGETGVDFRAHGLGLFTQPAAQQAERDDVIAVVLHLRRRRQTQRARRAQQHEAVLGRRGVERRALFLPVGDQLVQRAGLEHGARQNVRADFRAFLDDADRAFRVHLP